MRASIVAFVTVVASVWLAGCETTSSRVKDGPIFLAKGMTGDEVKELIGEPDSTRQVSEQTQVWVYEETNQQIRAVQPETREVPYVDIVTGELKTRPEGVTNIETSSTTLITELYMVNGVLVGWRESVREAVDFQGLQ